MCLNVSKRKKGKNKYSFIRWCVEEPSILFCDESWKMTTSVLLEKCSRYFMNVISRSRQK